MSLIPQDLINRYLAAKAQATQASRTAQQLAAEIQARMGEAERVQAGPYTVHWTRLLRHVANVQRLKDCYPVIYEDCCELKESRRFEVKGHTLAGSIKE
jgi:predicted phage-related endonuclease